MKIKLWASAACFGALAIGFVAAEAQQYAPGGPRVGVGSSPFPPEIQRRNPGVQAQPGATYGRRTTAQRPGSVSATGQVQQSPNLDAAIVAQLAIGSAEEIAMSQLGERRAESREVREFARMMVDEHRAFLDRLNQVQPDMVATFGRLSAQTAGLDDEGYERRTVRRPGDNRFDSRSGRRADDFRSGDRGGNRSFDDAERRGSARGVEGAGDADTEANFRRERGESGAADRAGTDRTGTDRSGRGQVGNSVDQPTGGDEDVGPAGANQNQTGTAGPSGTGAGSTGGIGTRTGEGRQSTGGSSGANTGGASGIGAGTSGTNGTGASGAGTGAGTSGAGQGTGTGGTGAGAGGTGAGASGAGGGAGSGGAGAGGGAGGGGAGGSGASLSPNMKAYFVLFQGGSQDENEDAQVPNRRRSRDVEVEGTTIGPDQTGPRGGYNQESTSQDGGGSRGSRANASRGGESYDQDDYRGSRASSTTGNSRSYDPRVEQRSSDGYATQGAAGTRARYADDYDARRMPTQRVSAQADMASSPFLQMQREVAERCLANAQRELEDKEGIEFDMAFMGMQIVAHNRMLATLQAARQQASPQLARVIDEGIETTEQHLDHAREIVENLQRDENRSPSRERDSGRQ